MIKKTFKKWKTKVWKSFLKKFPLSLINIILILTITYIAIGYVAGFGILAFLGYLFYSTINLNKLIEHPWKSAVWALVYIAGAIIFDIFLSKAIPMFSKGDGASLFSATVLCTILLYLWLKSRKYKK